METWARLEEWWQQEPKGSAESLPGRSFPLFSIPRMLKPFEIDYCGRTAASALLLGRTRSMTLDVDARSWLCPGDFEIIQHADEAGRLSRHHGTVIYRERAN